VIVIALVLVVVLDSTGRARLQNVTGCRLILPRGLLGSNGLRSMAEPGVWRGKRMESYRSLWLWISFLRLREHKLDPQAKG
jgi:hypothetical protein